MNDYDYLTSIRRLANETGWTPIYDSGPCLDGRLAIFAIRDKELKVRIGKHGAVQSATLIGYCGINVADTYLHGRLQDHYGNVEKLIDGRITSEAWTAHRVMCLVHDVAMNMASAK